MCLHKSLLWLTLTLDTAGVEAVAEALASSDDADGNRSDSDGVNEDAVDRRKRRRVSFAASAQPRNGRGVGQGACTEPMICVRGVRGRPPHVRGQQVVWCWGGCCIGFC